MWLLMIFIAIKYNAFDQNDFVSPVALTYVGRLGEINRFVK
jgi:hypothetical protein